MTKNLRLPVAVLKHPRFMENTSLPGRLRQFEIPGRVMFANGGVGLPKINITTNRSTAEIYLHGAHVTDFQKKGEPPLPFLSRLSQFATGKTIRRGVPVCFPWSAGARANGARICADHGMGID